MRAPVRGNGDVLTRNLIDAIGYLIQVATASNLSSVARNLGRARAELAFDRTSLQSDSADENMEPCVGGCPAIGNSSRLGHVWKLTPRSQPARKTLDAFACESEVRSYCRHFPVVFARAVNAEVWDEEERRYIDLLAGCGSLNYGHNHPHLKVSLLKYILDDGVASSMDLRTTAKRALLEELTATILKPRGLDYRVQFTGPTGTNAVEAAMKLARKVTGRRTIAAFTNAFHGVSLGALAATASPFMRGAAGVPLDHVVRLAYDQDEASGAESIYAFEDRVAQSRRKDERPAAFIVETVQGEGGLNVAGAEWLRDLAAIAKRLGALLIVDDIQAGCGRTGPFFSFERAGLYPDLVCLSKSIGGIGLPLSLVLIRPDLDRWRPGEHNGTFRGNNMAFVTAAAALELWRDDSFAVDIIRKARIVADWAKKVCDAYPGAVTHKGLGLLQGLSFAEAEDADGVRAKAFNAGVIVETCGQKGDVIKIMPPLTIEDDLLREALGRLRSAIDERLAPAVTLRSFNRPREEGAESTRLDC